MNDLNFAGRTVLVVGGSSGLGNGIAQAFRGRGAAVHVWGTRARAADYAGNDGSDLAGLGYAQVDVADAAAIDGWVPPFDRLDVLVLSQGTAMLGGQEYEAANFRKVMDVNLTSVMACAMKFRSMLSAAKGAVVMLNSVGGTRSNRGIPAYDASKAALGSLTRLFAMEWGADGVRVNGVAPGFVPTRLTSFATKDPARVQAYLGKVPLGRVGSIGDVADAVLFLASPMASYITGVTLPVDGGRLLT